MPTMLEYRNDGAADARGGGTKKKCVVSSSSSSSRRRGKSQSTAPRVGSDRVIIFYSCPSVYLVGSSSSSYALTTVAKKKKEPKYWQPVSTTVTERKALFDSYAARYPVILRSLQSRDGDEDEEDSAVVQARKAFEQITLECVPPGSETVCSLCSKFVHDPYNHYGRGDTVLRNTARMAGVIHPEHERVARGWVFIPACGHRFHGGCLQSWVGREGTITSTQRWSVCPLQCGC